VRNACGGGGLAGWREVKFREVGGWRAGLAVGVWEEGEVDWVLVVMGCEREVVVVMLRAEAVEEDCAVREGKAEVVPEVEEGVVEAGLV